MIAALLSAGCGGGASLTPPSITEQQRIDAAVATATADKACQAIRPFYWEIGDRGGRRVSGSLLATGNPQRFDAGSTLSIASASKWLYGAYVVEALAGELSTSDIQYLSFRSGYTSFDNCQRNQTVGSCLATGTNGLFSARNQNLFFYNSGHMQTHAVQMNLGPLDNAALATRLREKLGTEIEFGYTQPQLAGGAFMSADAYARFLRKMLDGQLRIAGLLGRHAVCTNPVTCPGVAAVGGTPIPLNETWHYSLGHWVEDDPVIGDGAFSSPGAFGFYPWIDKSKTWYGLVVRAESQGYFDSVECGRLIRKAWLQAKAP